MKDLIERQAALSAMDTLCGARYIGNYDSYDEPYEFNYCPNCGADMRRNE